MVKSMVLENRRFCPDNPEHHKTPPFRMWIPVLLLLSLPSSFKIYHFDNPSTTVGGFCSQHGVGAGQLAGCFCAGFGAGLFRAEKLDFSKFYGNDI